MVGTGIRMRKKWIIGCICAGFILLNGTGSVLAEETGTTDNISIVSEEEAGIEGNADLSPAEGDYMTASEDSFSADAGMTETVTDFSSEDTDLPDEILPSFEETAGLPEGTAEMTEGCEQVFTEDLTAAGDPEDTEDAEAYNETDDRSDMSEKEADDDHEDSPETCGPETAACLRETDDLKEADSMPLTENEAADALKENLSDTAVPEAAASRGTEERFSAQMAAVGLSAAGNDDRKTPSDPECSMLLSNGVYNIFTMLRQSLALTGGSSGAAAAINTKTSDKTQRFKLVYDSLNRAYTIVNEASGLALSAASSKSDDTVTTAATDGSARQRWVIKDNEDGTYSVLSQYNNRVLFVNNSNGSAGETVLAGTPSDITAQKWLLNLVGSSVRLSDGVYEISLKSDPSLAAGTNGQSMSDNVGINLQKTDNSDSQKFAFTYMADGTYRINNYNSGKALSASGTAIVQKSPGGNPQRWILSGAGNGAFYFINAATGEALEAGGVSAGGGKYLQSGKAALASSQQFMIAQKSGAGIANGTYSLNIVKNPSLVMSAAGSAAAGAQIKNAAAAASGSDAATQNFTIKSIGNGYFQILNSNSGMALAVRDRSTADSASVVQQNPASGNLNQMWIIHKEDNGAVSLINANSGKMAVVSGTSAGNWIIQKEFDNSASRLYRMLSPQMGPVCDMLFPNGIYTISSGLGNNMMLSVAGSSSSAGANIQINRENGSKAQRFRLTYDWARKSYTITNENSGLAVSPVSGSLSNGLNVDQESDKNWVRQHWAVRSAGNGQYQIVNQWSGKVLDVSGGKASDGTNVAACASSGGTNQKWGVKLAGSSVRLKDGIYEISYSQKTDLNVGTERSLMTDNANVQLQNDNNTDNQRFIFTYLADGTYLINNYNSGRTLSADSNAARANVVQHSKESGNNQKWILAGSGTGWFYLVNPVTGSAVTAAAGSSPAANGTNLITSAFSGEKTQQFGISYCPAPASDEGTYNILSAESTNWGMHVKDGSRKVNAHVELSRVSSSDADSQKFRLTSTGDGYYTITNVKSKHVLGLYAGYGNNGFNLHQEAASRGGDLGQKWLVHHNSNGTVSFINAKTGKTAMSQSTAQTKDMIQSDYTFTANRQFKLQKTTGNDTAAVDNSYEPKAYEDTMIMYANRFESKTNHIIIVDRDHFCTKVYSGSKGNWKEIKSWICSVGSPGHPTTPGEQEIRFKAIYFNSNYMRLYFASGLSTGRLFHSIGYYNQPNHTPRDPGPVYDGTLGARITGGCIRLAIGNARWIYYNCPVSTKVYIY